MNGSWPLFQALEALRPPGPGGKSWTGPSRWQNIPPCRETPAKAGPTNPFRQVSSMRQPLHSPGRDGTYQRSRLPEPVTPGRPGPDHRATQTGSSPMPPRRRSHAPRVPRSTGRAALPAGPSQTTGPCPLRSPLRPPPPPQGRNPWEAPSASSRTCFQRTWTPWDLLMLLVPSTPHPRRVRGCPNGALDDCVVFLAVGQLYSACAYGAIFPTKMPGM